MLNSSLSSHLLAYRPFLLLWITLKLDNRCGKQESHFCFVCVLSIFLLTKNLYKLCSQSHAQTSIRAFENICVHTGNYRLPVPQARDFKLTFFWMKFGVAGLSIKHSGLLPNRTLRVSVWSLLMAKSSWWRLFFLPVTWIQPTSLFYVQYVCVIDVMTQWMNDALCLLSLCYTVLGGRGGLTCPNGFNFMPNDWTVALLSHLYFGLCFLLLQVSLLIPPCPPTRLTKQQHFSSLLSLLTLGCHLWFHPYEKPFRPRQTRTWRGLEIVQLLDCRRRRLWRIVSQIGEKFFFLSRFFSSCDFSGRRTRAQIQTGGADERWCWFENSAVFQSGSRHYASTGRYIFTDQLYLAVCTMIVATVWAVNSGFLYLRSSKTPSTVCLWCIFGLRFVFTLFFLVLTSSPLPQRARLQREVYSRSVFYQGTFTLNLQDTTLRRS